MIDLVVQLLKTPDANNGISFKRTLVSGLLTAAKGLGYMHVYYWLNMIF